MRNDNPGNDFTDYGFNPDGTNDRALTVQGIRGGTAVAISGAPRTLVAGN